MKKLLGVVLGVVLVVALAGPASARADETATFVCVTEGEVSFVLVVDANATFGQNTANAVYNAVNPFGSVCSIQ